MADKLIVEGYLAFDYDYECSTECSTIEIRKYPDDILYDDIVSIIREWLPIYDEPYQTNPKKCRITVEEIE